MFLPDEDIFVTVPTLIILGPFSFREEIGEPSFLWWLHCHPIDLRRFSRNHLTRLTGNFLLFKTFQEMQGHIRFIQPIFLSFTWRFFNHSAISHDNVRNDSPLAKIKKILHPISLYGFSAQNTFLDQSDFLKSLSNVGEHESLLCGAFFEIFFI